MTPTPSPAAGRQVERGSEAYRQCPQLQPGMYVCSVQVGDGRVQPVGGLHIGQIRDQLMARPLTVTFAATAAEVDREAVSSGMDVSQVRPAHATASDPSSAPDS